MDYVDRLRTLNRVWSPLGPLGHLQLRFPRSGVQGGSRRQPRGARAAVVEGVPLGPLPLPAHQVCTPHACSWGLISHYFQGWVFAGALHSDQALCSPPCKEKPPGTASLPLGLMTRPWGFVRSSRPRSPVGTATGVLPPSRAWARTWAGTSLGPRPGNGGCSWSPDLQAETEGQAELGQEPAESDTAGQASSS